MIETIYICDICKEKNKNVKAIYFTSTKQFTLRDKKETEKHLCSDCEDSFRKYFLANPNLDL